MPPLLRRDGNQTILTLGLELEFLLLNLGIDDNPHAIIKNALEEYGAVPFALSPSHHQINPVHLPEVRGDIRLDHVYWFPQGVSTALPSLGGFGGKTTPRENTRYNCKRFNLMNENGIDPKREEGVFGPTQEIGLDGEVRVRQSMEIATPIMREGSWRRVVFSMLDSLESLTEDTGLGIQFNKDTGLHVHVGRRGGWSICQLKKILKAVVVFEEAMDLQHPKSRVRSNVNQRAVNIKSNIELMKISNISKLKRLRFIDSKINSRTVRTRTEGLMRLYTLTNGNDKGTKYNFLPIKETGTVEFRQAIASLDYDYIDDWINVVLDFVCAAISTTREAFETLARAEDDNYDMLDTFLIYGRGYRFCCWGLEEDLEDELPAEEDELEKKEGIHYYEDTYFPEDKEVKVDRKGKGLARDFKDTNGKPNGNWKGKGKASRPLAVHNEEDAYEHNAYEPGPSEIANVV